MITDLQKANPWKRISAYLFDLILLVTLTVGIAFLLSSVLGYDVQSDRMEALSQKYATLYGVDLDISVEDYNALSPEEHARYDAATEAFAADAEANYLYSLLINLTLIITTFSILISYLILEFAVPLLFGNGQTLGKKIFGIGVIFRKRTDAWQKDLRHRRDACRRRQSHLAFGLYPHRAGKIHGRDHDPGPACDLGLLRRARRGRRDRDPWHSRAADRADPLLAYPLRHSRYDIRHRNGGHRLADDLRDA